jgi:hypothetical protein
MSQLGYDLAYSGETPFEGEEGYVSAMQENVSKFRLGGVHYTPNMDIARDLEKIALQSFSQKDFEQRAREYLTS